MNGTIQTKTVQKEETVSLPLFISFYVENGYIIMNFNKRIILNDKNKPDWVDLLNEVANGKSIQVPCSLVCRDEMVAKFSLKQLGLLKTNNLILKK
jgi:hypothetical protein